MSVVIATGSASGIGAACLGALSEDGHEVIGWDVLDSVRPVDVSDVTWRRQIDMNAFGCSPRCRS